VEVEGGRWKVERESRLAQDPKRKIVGVCPSNLSEGSLDDITVSRLPFETTWLITAFLLDFVHCVLRVILGDD